MTKDPFNNGQPLDPLDNLHPRPNTSSGDPHVLPGVYHGHAEDGKAYRIVAEDELVALKDAAALATQPAPAEPVTCKGCAGRGVVDDGWITGSGGVEYENGPVKCVKDCPVCNGKGTQPAESKACAAEGVEPYCIHCATYGHQSGDCWAAPKLSTHKTWTHAAKLSNDIKEAIKELGGVSFPDLMEAVDQLAALAFSAPVPAVTEALSDPLPRYILWDSKHPDYPVEWSNPGRPPRDGEIGFFRHDIVNELLDEQRAALASPAPSVGEPSEDVALIQSVLNGYPKSMAREDAMRSLRRISAKLVTAPNVMKAAAEAFGYEGGLQTVNEGDLIRLAEGLATPERKTHSITSYTDGGEGLTDEARKLNGLMLAVWACAKPQPDVPREKLEELLSQCLPYIRAAALASPAQAPAAPSVGEPVTRDTLRIGGRYNWKGQPERLVYMGLCEPRNGRWHQFAKVDAPTVCWSEVTDDDLRSFEATPPAAPAVTYPDPLQGAADWLKTGLVDVSVADIQSRLLIGYNRARRLFDGAPAAPVPESPADKKGGDQ